MMALADRYRRVNDLANRAPTGESPARFTIDEFFALAGAARGVGAGKLELVEGAIVRMSPAQSPDMYYKREVSFALHDIYRESRARVVQTELSLQLGAATLREADIGVLDRFGPIGRLPDPATVLLLVEIAHSSVDKDLNAKRLDYARADIPHYWVVDIDNRLIHVMSIPLDGDYAERRPVAFGEPLPVPETDRTIVID